MSKNRNEVASREPGKGFLVLNRPEGSWTEIKVTLDKQKRGQLIERLEFPLNEEDLNVGLNFRVYDITSEDTFLLNFLCNKLQVTKEELRRECPQTSRISSVNLAFDDPNRYFQIDRPERFHGSRRGKEGGND
jgi:hypothetical protein